MWLASGFKGLKFTVIQWIQVVFIHVTRPHNNTNDEVRITVTKGLVKTPFYVTALWFLAIFVLKILLEQLTELNPVEVTDQPIPAILFLASSKSLIQK